MMIDAPSEAVKSNGQKCSGSGTDVGEWRKISCCFNRHLMDQDFNDTYTRALAREGSSHLIKPRVGAFTLGRCRSPCPEGGGLKLSGSLLRLWTEAARSDPSSEGCSCCQRQSLCKIGITSQNEARRTNKCELRCF